MHGYEYLKAITKDIKDKEKVKEINLEIGELAGIEAHHLKEVVEEVTGWIVNVETKTGLIDCPHCGYRGKVEITQRLHDLVLYCCPQCKLTPRIISGNDIKIKSVKYKD